MRLDRWWVSFWAKAGAVSIQIKIIGIVILCILSAILGMTWYVHSSISSALEEQLKERGVAIGSSTAARSRNLILTDRTFSLYNLVEETIKSDPDIAYIFILDADGEVLVHTLEGGFPADLLGINIINDNAKYQITRVQTEKGVIQDVAVPVLEGTAGVVRLGMSETAIRATVASYVQNSLEWMAAVLLVGIMIAFGLSRLLTKPVSQMVGATRAISLGDFKWKAPIWAKDEIGRLGDAFNRMSQELSRREEMRKQLLSKVISIQEEERKRIARELHDGTSQVLASIRVELKLIEEAASLDVVRERTAAMRILIAIAMEDVNELALQLRPSVLDDLGLVPALKRYLKEYSISHSINIDYHMSDLDRYKLLPEVQTAIYRVIQEALTNIAKYAEARNVSVVIEHRGKALVVIVEDDGRGFDVNSIMELGSEKRKGLGLFGMQERAYLIGGTLTIESHVGAGTTIFLEIPLELAEVIDEKDKDSIS